MANFPPSPSVQARRLTLSTQAEGLRERNWELGASLNTQPDLLGDVIVGLEEL